MRNSASERVCDSTFTTRHSIDNMIDEQEIPGASDKAEDAPSLHASRFPERPRKPTQRYTESQLQKSPPKPSRSRKRKTEILIYDDSNLATPPLTQLQTQLSQGTNQEGIKQPSRQKRAKKSSQKSSQDNVPLEPWEVKFQAAEGPNSKLQVLLSELGRETFSEKLFIPERQPEILISDDEINPTNPLSLWYKFIQPELL
jgi:hypothetical protein